MNKGAIASVAITAVILSFLFLSGFLSNINLKLTDNFYGGKAALDSVVIAGIDDKSLQEIGKWPWNRSVIARLIDSLEGNKAIGIDIGFYEKSEDDRILAESIKKSGNVILNVQYYGFDSENGAVKGKEILVPVDELIAANYGYANVITDKDSVTRAVNLGLSDEYPSFAAAVYEVYWGKKFESKEERFLVNYAGSPYKFKHYSASDIINGKIKLKDKLVLIGATSPDLHDNYFVPTSKGTAMPGVEIHANTIQSIINNDFLKEQSNYSVLLMIFIFAAAVAVISLNFSTIAAAASCFAIAAAYILFSILIFNYGIMMNVVYGILSIAVPYVVCAVQMYISEKESKKKIVGAFEKYVSSQVLTEILKEPDNLKLGGIRKDITVLFSDIRGFTSFSEHIEPEKLVKLLNEYLTLMTNIIMKKKGVVDKYIGDAIMAIWGAPLQQENHAELACETALEMIEVLKKHRQKWIDEGYPELKIGIGLNSGDAVVGNMGSFERFDYTAIGDNINLGSRLESLTKQYGVDIIISDSTKIKAGAKFHTRLLDIVAVKGKKNGIKIHELMPKESSSTAHYDLGFKFYLDKKWDSAIKEFEKCNDSASKMMIERCKIFKKDEPENWTGVFEMKTK